MNAPTMKYADPQDRSRLDTLASSFVLATMLASILAGAFLAEADPTQVAAQDRPAYAAERLS